MLINSPDCSVCLFSWYRLLHKVGGVGGDFSQTLSAIIHRPFRRNGKTPIHLVLKTVKLMIIVNTHKYILVAEWFILGTLINYRRFLTSIGLPSLDWFWYTENTRTTWIRVIVHIQRPKKLPLYREHIILWCTLITKPHLSYKKQVFFPYIIDVFTYRKPEWSASKTSHRQKLNIAVKASGGDGQILSLFYKQVQKMQGVAAATFGPPG